LKLAKTIAVAAAILGLAAVYGIDENADGVIDGYLFIEESDTLA
jgi:hypothetical protein